MKKTRKQKQIPGKKVGQSKYALKVKARKNLANELGLPDMPYPILLLNR